MNKKDLELVKECFGCIACKYHFSSNNCYCCHKTKTAHYVPDLDVQYLIIICSNCSFFEFNQNQELIEEAKGK